MVILDYHFNAGNCEGLDNDVQKGKYIIYNIYHDYLKLSHLYQLIKSHIPLAVTVLTLQNNLEKFFIGKVRSSIVKSSQYSAILPSLLGYDPSKTQIGYDRFWDGNVEKIDESQLVLWEKVSLDPYKLEFERYEMRQRMEKEKRVVILMNRKKNYLIYNIRYNIKLKKQVGEKYRGKSLCGQFISKK